MSVKKTRLKLFLGMFVSLSLGQSEAFSMDDLPLDVIAGNILPLLAEGDLYNFRLLAKPYQEMVDIYSPPISIREVPFKIDQYEGISFVPYKNQLVILERVEDKLDVNSTRVHLFNPETFTYRTFEERLPSFQMAFPHPAGLLLKVIGFNPQVVNLEGDQFNVTEAASWDSPISIAKMCYNAEADSAIFYGKKNFIHLSLSVPETKKIHSMSDTYKIDTIYPYGKYFIGTLWKSYPLLHLMDPSDMDNAAKTITFPAQFIHSTINGICFDSENDSSVVRIKQSGSKVVSYIHLTQLTTEDPRFDEFQFAPLSGFWDGGMYMRGSYLFTLQETIDVKNRFTLFTVYHLKEKRVIWQKKIHKSILRILIPVGQTLFIPTFDLKVEERERSIRMTEENPQLLAVDIRSYI